MLIELKHPVYRECLQDWSRWRDAFIGDRNFIHNYLIQFASEEAEDFTKRKNISYSPNFAQEAIIEIRNAIYQRMPAVTRTGGDETYQNATQGLIGGVDLEGSSLTHFIGNNILDDLLTIAKVGILVDMPELKGTTLLENKNRHPYLYSVAAEAIENWGTSIIDNEIEYTKLLIKDTIYEYDEEYNLPKGYKIQWRYFQLVDGGVLVETRNDKDEVVSSQILKLSKIPFICIELPLSLMTTICEYQIALLNINSSDIAYILASNIPMYTEQYSPQNESEWNTQAIPVAGQDPKPKIIKVGAKDGRRYPKDLERPGFIHPSSEPLKISMEKEEQMKREIRQLVQLNVQRLEAKFASAESKGKDDRTLESGLTFIGMQLEKAERKIAKFWAEFMNVDEATVNYPQDYSLKTDAERIDDTKETIELVDVVPSRTYNKEVCKKAATKLLGDTIDKETLDKIHAEIDNANFLTSNSADIKVDVELGLVTKETASLARGYEKGESDKAKDERAEEIALIQSSQTEGGINKLDPNSKGGGNGRPKTMPKTMPME